MASILGVEQLQHTNGTTAATIDSSGYIFPKLPHFSAKATSAQAVASNTVVTAAIDTSVSDTHSFVDLSNNRINFSATNAGTYLITYSAKIDNGSSTRFGMWAKKNTGGNYIAYFEDSLQTGSSSGSYAMPSFTFMYPFVSGDALQVDFYQASGGSISTNASSASEWSFQISGVRIG